MKYTFFWLDGIQEVLEAKSPEHAFEKPVYGFGAIKAIYFFAEGDNKKYMWHDHKWIKISSFVTVHALENDTP